jgi:hypothetical protein
MRNHELLPVAILGAGPVIVTQYLDPLAAA